jgi:sulfatase modifying factor 1
MSNKTYYDILEVSPNATQEEISESYKLLASMIHPDRFTQGSKQWAKANEKLKELNNANDTLKDPQKRADYDAQIGASRPSAGAASTQGSQARQEPRQESRSSTQSGPSSARSAQESVNSVDGARMIYIPAGEFIRGSEDWSRSQPVQRIHLDGYWIYKYPVTVAQYRAFCRATGREMPSAPSWGWIDNHPIVNVSWDDAAAYARWAEGRLPTEAQWEKAARGTDGREYPWGNQWDSSRLHCSKRNLGDAVSTAPVGSYPSGASPYGMMDMAGNVWEWCSDWYDENYYARAPSRNPENTQMSTDRSRVLRGGSWGSYRPGDFRCPYRADYGPNYWGSDGGFRVARQA